MLGDLRAAGRFLKALVPFVWRRSLDYAAVLDIQAIKRQIHVTKTGEGLAAAGANLKLGRGGIREIEFYAQTQQLILAGRDPALRTPRTIEALYALADAAISPARSPTNCRPPMSNCAVWSIGCRCWTTKQTHRLPEDAERRARRGRPGRRVGLSAFDAHVEALLARVNARYGELSKAARIWIPAMAVWSSPASRTIPRRWRP